MFHNILAQQGQSFSLNSTRLNFQVFALCDTKMAAQEGCRIGRKISYHFSFCQLNSDRHLCVPQKGTNMVSPISKLLHCVALKW